DGVRTHIFGQGGARATAEAAGAPFLGEIPLYPELREASDVGRPLTATNPDSAAARAFLAIAEKVGASLDAGAGPKPAPRIVFKD
ncbi:MAG: P-loop NTPase, partial [Pseudomonadota bacterium]